MTQAARFTRNAVDAVSSSIGSGVRDQLELLAIEPYAVLRGKAQPLQLSAQKDSSLMFIDHCSTSAEIVGLTSSIREPEPEAAVTWRTIESEPNHT